VSEPVFVPGGEVSQAFYVEVVRPLLAGRAHAAALLGWGSDVLGYDTERSTDHGWGPRLLVLLDDEDDIQELNAVIDSRLPERFRGWPVRFGWDDVVATHHVSITTTSRWLVDPTRSGAGWWRPSGAVSRKRRHSWPGPPRSVTRQARP
jgi:hypothetical protein